EIRELLKNSDKERDAKVVSTVEEVRGIIAEELDKIATGNRERSVAPTVTALRSHAKDVLASETARLEKKIGAVVDEKSFGPVLTVLHRCAEHLIHPRSLTVKEMAVTESEVDYAQALMQLFDLPVNKVAHAITQPETKVAKAASAAHVEADGIRPVADHT